MKGNATKAATLALASTFAGCASMPDVKVGYYEAKGALDVTVTQTAVCTAANVPVLTTDVVMTPRYFSDLRPEARHEVNLATLGNGWSKADAALEFFPDGRLKSINATQTGQAGDVLRAAVKLLSQFALLDYTDDQITDACERVREIVGDGKALSIVHRGSTDFPGATTGQVDFHQLSVSQSDYMALQPVFGTVGAMYTITPSAIPHTATMDDGDQRLMLTEPATAAVTVIISRGEDRAEWTGTALVPQHGEDYALRSRRHRLSARTPSS